MPNATDTTVKPAAELERDLRRQGYARDFPPGLTAEGRAIDRSIVRRMRCPACRKAGMEAHPHHKPGSYRIVAACLSCGAGEEM